ncbi:MAG: TetR/AcrR family transcriptional regulator [Myxococcales bacterium]|nr:TetR/AcrR family transcriptional regulator [Myxococcales bacterium]
MARPANPAIRQQLIDAAISEFAERGLRDTRVSDITDRAGTSKGTFYLHFESKEQIFEHIADTFLGSVQNHLAAYRSALDMQVGHDQIHRIVDLDIALYSYLADQHLPLRVVMEGAAGTPYAYLSEQFIENIEKYIRELLLTSPGSIARMSPEADIDAVAILCTGMFIMVAHRLCRGENLDLRRLSLQMHRMMCCGILRAEFAQEIRTMIDQYETSIQLPPP